MSIDVVIVTFRSAAHIEAAVASCRACKDIASVIVVDNASPDASAQAARGAGAGQVIVNPANEGFARAVNQGTAMGSEDTVLLLNPDARLTDEAVTALQSALDDEPQAAMAGPLLVEPDGRVLIGARRFSTPVNRLLWWLPVPGRCRPGWATPEYSAAGLAGAGARGGGTARARAAVATTTTAPGAARASAAGAATAPGSGAARPTPVTGPCRVDYLWGTALLVRRSFLDEIGGLDEHFFMYSEDEDLGRRARAAGRPVLLVTAARVSHVSGASSPDRSLALARMQAANRLLLEKWEGRRAAAVFWAGLGPVLAVRQAALRLAGRRDEAAEAARQRRHLRAARAELDRVAAARGRTTRPRA